jgi:hypothetical protein
MKVHQFHAFAAECARRLEHAGEPEVRERILRELNDWLDLAERRRLATSNRQRGAQSGWARRKATD